MKRILIIYCLIFFSSCSFYGGEKDFEAKIGVENARMLDSLVDNFENQHLASKYPSLSKEQAYEQFISDLAHYYESDYEDYYGFKIEMDSELIQEFVQSSLSIDLFDQLKEVTFIPNYDSTKYDVKYTNRSFTFRGDTLNGSSSTRVNEYDFTLNTDSLLNIMRFIIEPNTIGEYRIALNKKFSKEDFILNLFSKNRKVLSEIVGFPLISGDLAPGLFAQGLTTVKINYNDYYLKKVIFTDIISPLIIYQNTTNKEFHQFQY